MSGIVRLINVQRLGACCGVFESFEKAIEYLRAKGFSGDDFGCNYQNNTVWFRGGNC